MSSVPRFIGVAGGTAGGKTEFARLLENVAPTGAVTVITLDSYYKRRDGTPLEERARLNYDHPDALDIDLLIDQLRELKAGRQVKVPIYNFAVHNREDGHIPVAPTKLVVVEGILVLALAGLREFFDLKIFVHTPDDIRLVRRIDRDIVSRGRTRESVIQQWIATVQPMHVQFCYPSREHADIVVSGETDNGDLALDILKRYIEF
ncbi:MAG: uridine kinase [Oligoflexia bacterium]|nr:uridine kinase [Oligoflexia bacterium]